MNLALSAGQRSHRAWAETIHAEWTKLRTLASTGWLLAGVVALTMAVSAAAVAAAAGAPGLDLAKLSLTGIQAGQAVVVILAVQAISNEYSTGMIRVTLTAMPRRITVLLAKAAVLTGLVLAAGTAGVLASVLAGRLILPPTSPAPFFLANGTDLRAAAGSVLYLALIGLLALGTATAVRDSATSIGVVLGLLYLFPVIAGALGPYWSRHLQQIGPMSAGLDIQSTAGLGGLPLSPWQGLGVLALWAVVALLAGGLVLWLRDG